MLHSAKGLNGCVTAPHLSAALAGRDILARGGTAIEAMVAAAATIAVVYPHMNSIGGDGFWIIERPGEKPVGISACGRAAGLATPDWYRERGHGEAMPTRGAACRPDRTGDDFRLGEGARHGGSRPPAAARRPPRGRDRLCAGRHGRHRQPGRHDGGQAGWAEGRAGLCRYLPARRQRSARGRHPEAAGARGDA